ncbi:MAG: BatD family protein [Rikenellaceae bacterium]
MRRLLFIYLILPFVSFAQSATFVTKAPTLVAMGEPFKVEFVANAKIADFSAPSFDGFNVIAGPTTSSSSNVSYVNGNITKFEEYSYTYVLVGKQEGNTSIKSAKAKVDGKEMSTKELPIEVVKESRSGGSSNSGGQASTQGHSTKSVATNTIADDDVLLRVVPSKTSVYLGEPISLQLKLYSRARISSLKGAKLATFDGFWNQELGVSDEPMQRDTYNNKVYDTWVIKEFLLFPQKAGKLNIEKMSVDVVVSVSLNTGSSGSLFDSFFGGGTQVANFTQTISSEPIPINVKSLPSGAPSSFNGAVGDFTISGAMNESKISANASNALVLTIKGKGNFPLLSTPKVELPASFELYPSKSKDLYTTTSSTISGSKIFDYPFVARAEGDYHLAGVEFSYFSPTQQQYITLTTDDFNVDVLKDVTNRSSNGSSIISSVTKDDLKILGKDIHFIKVGDSKLKPIDRFIIGSWYYFLIIVLLIGVFVAVIIYMKKHIKEMRDTAKQRNKKANKVAISRLKKAKKFKSDNMQNEFYSEMLRALTGYIGDKLNIEVSRLSKETINGELSKRNIPSSDIEQLMKTISDCEFAQYSPISNVTMSDVYDNTLDLIGRLESKL